MVQLMQLHIWRLTSSDRAISFRMNMRHYFKVCNFSLFNILDTHYSARIPVRFVLVIVHKYSPDTYI
ncbi:hypothetical protein P245_25320 [Comamonas thiooxydans]|uniref:Uncharacterized protein n=1 Tax=Comamonas thiooxydans TaxID=363952 RepID=A0A0E3B7F0_9BURK|nr:hypothetical protein P245_25320 [Comamonas thiooxydans]